MDETFNLARSTFYRFLRGGIAGAISTGATVTVFTGVQTWSHLPTALSVLGLMAFIGFVTGGLLAADKYVRSLPEDAFEH